MRGREGDHYAAGGTEYFPEQLQISTRRSIKKDFLFEFYLLGNLFYIKINNKQKYWAVNIVS